MPPRSGDTVDGDEEEELMGITAGAGTWTSKAESAQEAQLDSDLVALTQAARRGSEAAFAALFERFQTPIVNYLYRLMDDWEVANDLAQDTFLKAYSALPTTDPSLQISPWLYRIATNT